MILTIMSATTANGTCEAKMPCRAIRPVMCCKKPERFLHYPRVMKHATRLIRLSVRCNPPRTLVMILREASPGSTHRCSVV